MNQRFLFIVCMLFIAASALGAGSAVDNRVSANANDTLVEARFPHFPHLGNSLGGKLVSQDVFEKAEVCGGCHQEIYKEWRSSIMSYSWEDPIYRALLKKASVATDGAVDGFCSGCHSPAGLLTGQINSKVTRTEPEKQSTHLPGVDCEACHRLSGVSGLTNGAYILDVSGGNVKRGPRKNAQSPHHKTAYSPLHRQSEMCGVCHNVSHPFNDIPIERTYDEWYESRYRTEGIECQDCHMPDTSGKAAVMGPQRKDRATHRFAAANTTIMGYFGAKESQRAARQLLRQSATVELIELPESVQPGKEVEVKVKVTNSGAGHKLPTGFPEGREVWLDFQVTDAAGKLVYRLGAVRDGKTEAGTKNFKVHLGDSKGKEVAVEVWRVDRILSDNRILPNGYSVENFEFVAPSTAKGPLTLSATLKYWPFSQALADELLGEDVLNVEIEEIASTSAVVEVNTVAVTAPPR